MYEDKNKTIKTAIEVIQPFKKFVKHKEFPNAAKRKSSVVDLEAAKAIAKAMEAGAYHEALNNTRVELYGSKINDLAARTQSNPRNSWVTRTSAYNPFEDATNTITQDLPDAYLYHPDNVWLPSGNPGVLMHELGHTADMNEYPKDSMIRRGIAGFYSKYAPTIWQEHAAWRKGKNRLLTGAAKTKLDPNILVKTLEQAARTKPMGLGSYWGGGLGTIAGGGLGLAAALLLAKNTGRIPIILPLAGAGFGGTAGALIGSRLGKYYGEKESLGDEKAISNYMNEYAKFYAREHGITRQEALMELEKMRDLVKSNAKKTKREAISKAASFGEFLGKQAAFRNLGAVPVGTGPDQMANALNMYNQARALVDPTKHLDNAGISRGSFDAMLNTLARRGDRYNFSELKRDSKRQAAVAGILGALGGGIAGKLSGQGIGNSLALATAGGATGAGLGYYDAAKHNSDLIATAKVLKEYGLLNPDNLRSALPLLKEQSY